MRNTFFLTFALAISTALNVSATNNAEITYIGNEGFMISNNDKKIFIDALYFYGSPSIIEDYDDSVKNMIIKNYGSYSNSLLYLVTHSHGDHYNQDMVTKYLKNNTQSKMVSTGEIVSGLKATANENQLVSFSPKKYESVDTTINGIQLTVYNFSHDLTYSTFNIGFYANIDGLKILHAGDNSIDDTTEYEKFKISEKNIDILFLWNYTKSNWKTKKNFIKKYINPKYIVLMHVKPSELSKIKTEVNSLNDSTFPPIIVFNASMEKIRINDPIVFLNNMPESQSKLADTTYLIDNQIDIKIPELFTDKDTNDSISYSVSGLPNGVSFNNATMNISGKAVKAGKYAVKVTGKDKSLCPNSITFKLTINDPTTGLKSKSAEDLDFYPNPASNILYINNLNDSQSTVEVYNINGRLMLRKNSIKNEVDITALAKGFYSIKLINSKKTQTGKFVKE